MYKLYKDGEVVSVCDTLRNVRLVYDRLLQQDRADGIMPSLVVIQVLKDGSKVQIFDPFERINGRPRGQHKPIKEPAAILKKRSIGMTNEEWQYCMEAGEGHAAAFVRGLIGIHRSATKK